MTRTYDSYGGICDQRVHQSCQMSSNNFGLSMCSERVCVCDIMARFLLLWWDRMAL